MTAMTSDEVLDDLRAEWRDADADARADIEATARAVKILQAGGLM